MLLSAFQKLLDLHLALGLNADLSLQAMDLSQAEYGSFGESVVALAAQRERKPRDFEAFRGFLSRHGPYGAVVDGANVALFGQNHDTGGFSFAQLEAVVSQLREERPGLRPLVVRHLHHLCCFCCHLAEPTSLRLLANPHNSMV